MGEADKNAEKALEELKGAQKHQKSAGKCMKCVVILVVIIIIAVAIIMIVIFTGKDSDSEKSDEEVESP